MTFAQKRLIAIITAYGENAEYWPVVNDWIKGDTACRPFPLALRNINRTVSALLRAKVVTINDDGYFQLVRR